MASERGAGVARKRIPLAVDEPCVLEDREVLGHRLAGDGQRRGELGRGLRAPVRDELEDLPAGRVPQRREDLVGPHQA
jgi:hypothetical protein